MIKEKGNLFVFDYKIDVLVCPTNRILKKDDSLVMGAGLALEFTKIWPALPHKFGAIVKNNPNPVSVVKASGLTYEKEIGSQVDYLVAFSTKHHWKEKSDIKLIEDACYSLIYIATAFGWDSIRMPKVGCGLGGLGWKSTVESVLSDILDDRFTIVDKDI